MFRKDFMWGVGMSSFQIEGGIEDRGQTTWDMFCRKKGMIKGNHDTSVTCDHYHLYPEDFALMKSLGIRYYRMAICWTRILPNGTGEVSKEGIEYYHKVFDELEKNGITPIVGIFHWDYPYTLHQKGGWLNPESPIWFEEYVHVLMNEYSDKIQYWETINESQSFVESGHLFGEHAPGLQYSEEDFLRICHNVLLAHGYAVRCIRKYAKKPVKIGYAFVCNINTPADPENAEDIEKARKMMFEPENYVATNSLWVDPVVLGKYSDLITSRFNKYGICISEEDMKLISQPIDFLGANIYQSFTAGDKKIGPQGDPLQYATTNFGWAVTPEAMYWGTKFFYERYHMPIVITENGMSGNDWIHLDGKIHDAPRIDFMHRYLLELRRATDEGVPILGYFPWCFLDNFECAQGFYQRFGLVHVDFTTQKRTPKDSAYWYQKVVESNGSLL